MDPQWKFWLRQLRSKSSGQDELERITVGDPDPTSDSGTTNEYRTCGFEWADETSPTLILPWYCTRLLGHQGQHLAGTGERIAAVHLQLLPAATATSVSV